LANVDNCENLLDDDEKILQLFTQWAKLAKKKDSLKECVFC